jgi:lysophospholipase L1-like esterase
MAEAGGDALILPDHVHPNANGHAVIASTFAEATRLPQT